MSIFSPRLQMWFALKTRRDYIGGRGYVTTYYVAAYPEYAYTRKQIDALIASGAVREDMRRAA